MSEATMIELVQRALDRFGIEDEVVAVGQFNPRGHVGGLFAGGLVGGDAGSRLGGAIGGDIGVATGSIAGQRAADQASGLPSSVLVAVSAERVYGFDAPTRHSDPRALVFNLRRRTSRPRFTRGQRAHPRTDRHPERRLGPARRQPAADHAFRRGDHALQG
jgi:hypothetical protein